MSLEARIAKVVSASVGGAAPAWGAGGASSDAEWDSADEELRAAGDGGEEEEEVVEMDEAEVMALLDADTPALQVCQRLFHAQQPPPGALQLLPAAAAEQLRRDGWAVLPAFLPAAEAAAARAEALALHRGGAFGAAQAAAPADEGARGDSVLWLNHGAPPTASPGLAAAMAQLDALRAELQLLLALRGATELQLAVYAPGGAAYAKHRDAFPEDAAPEGAQGQRRVTAVLYANDPAWDCDAQGGALRLHVPPPAGDEDAADDCGYTAGAAWVDVAPRGGALALFLSGAVDHEVRPSREEHRVALTAWYR